MARKKKKSGGLKNLQHYQDGAVEVIESRAEKDRLKQMRAMDNMFYGHFSLPDKIDKLKWIIPTISSDPYDAVRVGMQVLSAVQPRIKLQPLAPDSQTRQRADKVERGLLWHFRNASRRQHSSVLRDITFSALLYDEIITQVVFLPHQIDQLKAFKGDTTRLENAKRFGPFSIVVRNPQQVHVKYSDWMAEEVLMRRTVPLHEAINFWGDRAKKLKRMAEKEKLDSMSLVTIFEFMDMKDRVVWATPVETNTVEAKAGDGDAVEIVREEHGLGFLPWVAVAGGSNLTDGEERLPLLYPLYTTSSWQLQNVVETLMTSETIAYSSAPKYKVTGPSSEDVEVEYGEPARLIYLPIGNDIEALQPFIIDQNLALISDRIAGRIGKSTVPKVIFGDIPEGAAFAAINMATQSGLKSLTPYKTLAEQALVGIFSQMLYWIDQEGAEGVIAFATNTKNVKRADCAFCGAQDITPNFDFQNSPQLAQMFPNGTCPECDSPADRAVEGQRDVTEQLVITDNDFDVDNIYMEVELTADVPTDRMARINAAAMAKRELGLSANSGLEDIGVVDPVQERDQAKAERGEEFEEQLGYKEDEMRRLGAIQQELQNAANAAELEQAQALAEAQAAANNPEGGGGPEQGDGETNLLRNPRVQNQFSSQRNRRKDNLKGQGFDRKMDGGSLAQADPNLTREEANQADRQGNELAGS